VRPAPRDRERVVGDLRSALTGGVIGVDTFELRIGRALAARTRRGLRDIVADLPVPAWRRAFEALRETVLGEADDPVWIHPPPQIEVGEALVIGRDDRASLVVDDPGVSRRHLMLRRDADGWTALDLQSTNGTYVNGWRVQRAQLQPGDELQVGDTRMRIAWPA
jgi:hypothetical protein